MKCVGCITGCGYVKGFIGIGLIALGAWFEMSNNEIVNCPALALSCPTAYGQMAVAMIGSQFPANVSAAPATVPADIMAMVTAYCNCVQSCVNYQLIYEEDVGNVALTNCFQPNALVVPQSHVSTSVAVAPVVLMTTVAPVVLMTTVAPVVPPVRRLLEKITPDAVQRRLIGDNPLSGDTCLSCADIQAQEDLLFRLLALLACLCGMALLITAFCEHIGMKMHNTCFSILVLFTDCAVSGTLVAGAIIAMMGAVAAHLSCNPEELRAHLSHAAAESTDGDADHTALYLNFLFTLFLPITDAICSTGPKFTTFSMLTSLGCTVSSLSCLATFCVCLGCSEDHEDPDDPNAEQAQQIQGLMMWEQRAAVVWRNQ